MSNDSLTALITEFRQSQAKDSITPEALGAILQRIANACGGDQSAFDSLQQELARINSAIRDLNSWHSALINALSYISSIQISPAENGSMNIVLGRSELEDGSEHASCEVVSLPAASIDNAGIMTQAQASALVENSNDIDRLKRSFDEIEFDQIDNDTIIDKLIGRMLRVYFNTITVGWLINVSCWALKTWQQVFISYLPLDEEGNIILAHTDDGSINIYSRTFNMNCPGLIISGSGEEVPVGEWSKWQPFFKRFASAQDLSDLETELHNALYGEPDQEEDSTDNIGYTPRGINGALMQLAEQAEIQALEIETLKEQLNTLTNN